MRRRYVLAALLLLAFAAQAQEPKYLFLNDIEGSGLDDEKRAAIGDRLTEALFRTKRWSVISHADIARFLEAQELVFKGILSPSGEMLSAVSLPADYVALCRVDREGESYAMNLQIRSLRDGGLFGSSSVGPLLWQEFQESMADVVWEASSLGKRTAEPGTGGSSLTVDADTAGASVYLNGVLRGKTPLVLNGLAKGFYSLEVRKDAYAYREAFELDGGKTIRARLKIETGNLIVKTEPAGAVVYVGSDSYPAGGLIANIPAKELLLGARKGSLVWRGPLRVLPGRTVEITLSLKPSASVSIESPEGVRNRLEGVDFLEGFIGPKLFSALFPGSYRLESVLGDKTFAEDFSLSYGDEASVRVAFGETQRESAERAARADALAEIGKRLDDLRIPPEYRERPVPDIRAEGIKTAFLSLVPVCGFALLKYPDGLALPEQDRLRLRKRARLQIGIGLGAQGFAASAVAASFAGREDISGLGYAVAGILAAADLLYGFWETASDSLWYSEQMKLQDRKSELERDRDAVSKDAAGKGGAPNHVPPVKR